MDLSMDASVCDGYKSPAQRARRLTEAWFATHMYCPACASDNLTPAPTNTQMTDFTCPSCRAAYELKAQRSRIGRKVVDAAYSSMMGKIKTDTTPHFAFLRYDREGLRALDLLLVPSHFITASVIERRRPLPATARRAGWEGCNILLDQVPPDGRLTVVADGAVEPRQSVREQWQRFDWLGEGDDDARGWSTDVLRLVRGLGRGRFSLAEAYEWEAELASLYPRNRNVRPKIRQQLQILRDRGVVRFVGGGQYEVIG